MTNNILFLIKIQMDLSFQLVLRFSSAFRSGGYLPAGCDEK